MLVAVLPEQLSVDVGLRMTKERLRLLRLLSSQADTAATVQADYAQLQEERKQIENEWAGELTRLVEVHIAMISFPSELFPRRAWTLT